MRVQFDDGVKDIVIVYVHALRIHDDVCIAVLINLFSPEK